MPQNKEIVFEFVLPSDNNLLSSYKGRHANITYTVKATADIAKRLDVNKEEHFSVFNPNNSEVISPSVNEENIKTVTVANTIEDKNNLSSSLPKEEDAGKESYSSRFERIFGKKSNRTTISYSRPPPRYFTFSGTGLNINLGSVFAKNREHFLKENSKARIELLNSNTPYSPSHIIKGKLILTQNQEEQKEEKNGIRGMKITLSGIEHAFAQGLQRVTTIEKYEIHMEPAQSGGYNDNSTIPFEFQIPDKVNQSYTAKYSEYFWGLEAKLNIAWSSDINARTIIEIV